MGRTEMVKLIVRKAKDHRYLAPWTRKWDGSPTDRNLAKWRDGFNQSLLPGGANDYLGTAYWIQCNLEIFDQVNGEVVATHRAPSFEVIPSVARNWTGTEHTPAMGTVNKF